MTCLQHNVTRIFVSDPSTLQTLLHCLAKDPLPRMCLHNCKEMAAALCRRRQQKGNGNYARAVHTRDVNADQTTQELRELRSRLAVCAAAIFHQQKLGKKIVENANYFAGAKDRCQEHRNDR